MAGSGMMSGLTSGPFAESSTIREPRWIPVRMARLRSSSERRAHPSKKQGICQPIVTRSNQTLRSTVKVKYMAVI